MAYIRQLKSGKWFAEVERHGNRRSKAHETKREAQAWALRQEAELDALKGSGAVTLGTAVAHYLETITPMKRSPRWEHNTFARLVKCIGENARLSSIDSARIAEWRNERMKQVSGSTIQREANLLRNLFYVAREEWRWIDHNPFRGVRMPDQSSPRDQVWTWPLIRRVLQTPAEGKIADVIRAFHLSLHTGLRLQEALHHEYDSKSKVITLRFTKSGRVERIPVTKRAAKLLPVTYSFRAETPEQLRAWANEASVLFSRLTDQLLIDDLTFHDARASCLTWLSRRMDVLTLARISRHRDLRILQQSYYRETPEQIAARL